jgi:hypothetical protein
VTPRLRRLDALRNDKGPNSGPLPVRGSNSDPRTVIRGSSAQLLASGPGTSDLKRALNRRRVIGIDEDDTICISPPRIEVCSEEQWQSAIDLLAELLIPAFRRHADDSKAA